MNPFNEWTGDDEKRKIRLEEIKQQLTAVRLRKIL
jgi:hypothetical protein